MAIPSSVTKLGTSAFRNCCKLTEVQLNVGLQVIGKCAFYNCPLLQSVAVPSSVTELKQEAFGGCANLAEVILLEEIGSLTGDSSTGVFQVVKELSAREDYSTR